MKSSKGKYVFLSYSTKNQDHADTIHEILEQNGIGVWMAPGDIPAGMEYADVIVDAIQQSCCLVIILTGDANVSPWVKREVERAVNYRKPLISLLFEDIRLSKDLELYLSTCQAIDMRNRIGLPSDYDTMITAIRRFIGEKEKQIYILRSLSGAYPDIPIHDKVTLIGRDPRKCDIVISNRNVSSIHASLLWAGDEIFLEDRNAMNGTFVNQKRIEKAQIHTGDIVQFANLEFQLETRTASAAPAVRSPAHANDPDTRVFVMNQKQTERILPEFRVPLGKQILTADVIQAVTHGQPTLIDEVFVPEGVTEIQSCAFRLIRIRRRIVLPASLTYFAPDAFTLEDGGYVDCRPGSAAWRYCKHYGLLNAPDLSLMEEGFRTGTVRVLEGTQVVVSNAYIAITHGNLTPVQAVLLPNGVRELQSNALRSLLIQDYILLPSSLERIGNNAFTLGEEAYVVCDADSRAYRYCQANGVRTSIDMRQRMETGRCRYCGGEFTFFRKICKYCGKPKDY